MKGVSYLTGEAGKQSAVTLDLKKDRRLWEDVHDRPLIESRRHEPRESLEQVKRRLPARAPNAQA